MIFNVDHHFRMEGVFMNMDRWSLKHSDFQKLDDEQNGRLITNIEKEEMSFIHFFRILTWILLSLVMTARLLVTIGREKWKYWNMCSFGGNLDVPKLQNMLTWPFTVCELLRRVVCVRHSILALCFWFKKIRVADRKWIDDNMQHYIEEHEKWKKNYFGKLGTTQTRTSYTVKFKQHKYAVQCHCDENLITVFKT